MKVTTVTTVTYARLRNLGNFENERVELEATVGDDEDPREVYAALRGQASELLYPEYTKAKAKAGPDEEPAF